MRTFVVGDLHGCYTTLQDAIEDLQINFEEDKVVFLGDYIDRGPFPIKTLKFVKNLVEKYPKNVVAIKGNHEDMCYNYFMFKDDIWMSNGHRTTKADLLLLPEEEVFELLKWMNSLPHRYEDDNFRYCHSGNWSQAIDIYGYDMALWDRDWMRRPCDPSSDKPIVFGHTPFDEYQIIGNNYGIDTGAVFGNGLSVLAIDHTKTIRVLFYPTNLNDLS